MTVKPGARPLLADILRMSGLWAVAVAQPLLDVLGRAPEFFVAHRAAPFDVLLLLAVLLLAGPVVLAAALAAASAVGPRTYAGATGTIVAVFTAAIVVQVLKHLGIETWTRAAPVATLSGAVVAVLYFRFVVVRTFLTILAAAMIIVPTVFAARPGIARLILPSGGGFAAIDPGQPDFRPAPIVLLVFDELPLISLLDSQRRIDPVVYPNLSRLARDGIWFRNATTVSDYTRWALPSILTGRRAEPSDIPTPGDHPDSLFSFLSRSHRLEVFEPVTNLCPRRLCPDADVTLRTRLAAIGVDLRIVAGYVFLTRDLHQRLRLPDLSAQWAGFSTADDLDVDASPRAWQRHVDRNFRDDRREIVTRFVGSISAADPQPTFYFLHTLLPHQPWVLLPTGQRNGSPAPLPSPMRVVAREDEWEIVQNQQRHLLQVGFVDHALGRVLARLKQAGLYDRALVVVTADHGVAITRGEPVRAFSQGNAAEIMRVPLIVKFPADVPVSTLGADVNASGQRVSDRNVETVDIAPTVAGVLGVPLPWKTDGASLIEPSIPPRDGKRIAFASGRKTHEYGPDGPSLDSLLRRRAATFGDGNVYHVPTPPRFAELVGRPVTDVTIVDDGTSGDLAFSWEYADYNSNGDTIPFDVSGRLHRQDGNADPASIAVVINGVIRAVTRTWTLRSGGWLATPPLDAWRRGRNSVDVFRIDERDDGPVLARVRLRTSRPEDLNLITGEAELYWGVRQRGFHRHEGRGGRVFRWSRPEASVTVPLLGERPEAIRLHIARAVDAAARLRVTANRCTLYDGVVPKREWETTLALQACAVEGDELTIGLLTTAGQVTVRRDSRRLGVAVRNIELRMAGGSP